MEANFVLKASDLTADFAEGLRKVSNNATLYIRVDFGTGSDSSTPGAASSGNTSTGDAPKKRGRKPGSGNKSSVAASPSEGPKKRGRKPGSVNKSSAPAATSEGPKKRGRKPKNQNA